MTIVSREWIDNAFWDNHQKDRIVAILRTIDDNDRVTTQTVRVSKYDDEGNRNRDYFDIIKQLGEEKLNTNTTDRHERKQKEQRERLKREQSQKRADMLAALFDAKIHAMEIPEIHNSTNRELKSKLRKARNLVELNIYSQLIVMEELGITMKDTPDEPKPKSKAVPKAKAKRTPRKKAAPKKD